MFLKWSKYATVALQENQEDTGDRTEVAPEESAVPPGKMFNINSNITRYVYNMHKLEIPPTVCHLRLRDAGAGVPLDCGGRAAAGGDIPGHGHAGRGKGSGQPMYTL